MLCGKIQGYSDFTRKFDSDPVYLLKIRWIFEQTMKIANNEPRDFTKRKPVLKEKTKKSFINNLVKICVILWLIIFGMRIKVFLHFAITDPL